MSQPQYHTYTMASYAYPNPNTSHTQMSTFVCPKYTKAHFCMSQPQYHTYTMATFSLFAQGVDYAIRLKSYNPLLWMVVRIVWYKIVHVGDFILSLLRLYLYIFRTFIYGFRYLGPREEPPFF